MPRLRRHRLDRAETDVDLEQAAEYWSVHECRWVRPPHGLRADQLTQELALPALPPLPAVPQARRPEPDVVPT